MKRCPRCGCKLLHEAAPTSEETVRSGAWLGEAPPTTPESEGWWWVRRVPQSTWERDNPRVALLKMVAGTLIASIWRWSGEHDVRTMEHWEWGGRIAVPGASPNKQIADSAQMPNERK